MGKVVIEPPVYANLISSFDYVEGCNRNINTSLFLSMAVAFSDSHQTLNVIYGSAKPVLRGPNSTKPNLFHHKETTYRIV